MDTYDDAKCMIYNAKDNTTEETKYYKRKIGEFSEYLAAESCKGKIPLIITGSGISPNVPGMTAMMDKLVALVKNADLNQYSEVFQKIYREYCDSISNSARNASEVHMQQSRLLTYIQNAYLGKNRFVQSQDVELLSNVWTQFVLWLMNGDDKWKGIINAKTGEAHKKITEFYKEMSAVSITTNFDNLLKKAFVKGTNFYPILDNQTFNDYYTSTENDGSYVEIQSRGDVFWVRCTGKNNRVCPNMKKRCYVPGDDVNSKDKVTCKLCGSPAEVYFAFPGTKEKDAEMALVMDGVWKFLAYRVSAVIIIGNSMDYDPVLLNFVRELIGRKSIPAFYISSYKKNEKGLLGINKKAATKYLFRNDKTTRNIWARAEKTEKVLADIINSFKSVNNIQEEINDAKSKKELYANLVHDCIGETDEAAFDKVIQTLKQHKDGLEFVGEQIVRKMEYYSQLGLKTYWLEGENEKYNLHNRYRHSIGVMLIASYLYLTIKKKPAKEELKFLQLAAFFHDMGHLPFSHLLEEIFQEFGWVSAGETKTFNHEQHTRNVIKDIFSEGSSFAKELEGTGYTIDDLYRLIGGEFGIGYLDALINSPLDCDKIEYLFSDAVYTGRGNKEDIDFFLKDFSEGLSTNSNDFLVLSGESTGKFLNLLEMRGQMYEEVYLRRGLRYLEACCKLIIKTFISCKCTEESLFKEIENNDGGKFFNLSETKIKYIIKWFEDKLAAMEKSGEKLICELYVLQEMVEEINRSIFISDEMKAVINNCHEQIKNVKSKEQVKEIEKDKIVVYDVSDRKYSLENLRKLKKDVYLRFPGILMVDSVQSKAAFSFGGTGFREKRSDGTSSAVESILIKDIHRSAGISHEGYRCLGDAVEDINKELHFPHHTYINLYRITDDSFRYMQAEDFVLSQLRKEGVISYE
ncbi:MAG: HD domain-containing protein [Bacillota bacterium]|nr:HD domain-containing protein [Bacillota bacterium]